MPEVSRVMHSPKIPINAYEYRKLLRYEIYPMIGGPIIKPIKLTLEMIVNAVLVAILVFLPTVLYIVGMILHVPNPIVIKAIVEATRLGKATIRNSPIAINIPPACKMC